MSSLVKKKRFVPIEIVIKLKNPILRRQAVFSVILMKTEIKTIGVKIFTTPKKLEGKEESFTNLKPQFKVLRKVLFRKMLKCRVLQLRWRKRIPVMMCSTRDKTADYFRAGEPSHTEESPKGAIKTASLKYPILFHYRFCTHAGLSFFFPIRRLPH